MHCDVRPFILICATALPLLTGCAGWEPRDPASPAAAEPAATPASATAPSEPAGESKGPVPPPRRDVPGRRGELALARIYVPDHFSPAGSGTDIVVWFLGAPWCAEQTFYDAHKNAVLVTVTARPLWETFRSPAAFSALLDEIAAWLEQQGITDRPIGCICLASFSGGYVAVREILKQDRHRDLVSDLVLADSLYAPRLESRENELDPVAMAPFLAYARRAAAGECVLLFSHLDPPLEEHRGNTTTLAASYLIDRLDVPRRPASTRNSRGAQLVYRADRGGFHVFGYSGMTTQDHFEHFYAASDLLSQTSLADAP